MAPERTSRLLRAGAPPSPDRVPALLTVFCGAVLAPSAQDVGASAHPDDVLIGVQDGEVLDVFIDDEFERGEQRVVGRDRDDVGAGDARKGRVGVTNAVLTDTQLDTPLAFETFTAAGSGLGAAGFIVYDDTACMVDVAAVLSGFLYVESCGQCPPCKLGTGAITKALDDIATGHSTDASLESIEHWLGVVADGNRCFLPVEEQQLIGSILRTFPDDFERHLRGECERPHRLSVPKLLDIADGRATFDARQIRKRPDWTYEP